MTVDWSADIRLLRQLLPMASEVHVVAADALLRRFRGLSKDPEAERRARILAVKLVAEAMSALEDLGALCWAVNQRDTQGLIHAYLHYRDGHVKTVYEDIDSSGFPWSYLRLCVPQEYVNNPDAESSDLIMDLNLILGSAAKWHKVERMIEVYNKTKHGFTVLDGPPGESSPQSGAEDAIYILAKDRRCIRLENYRQWPDRATMVIHTCADGWRNLAELIILMHEHGYDLGVTPVP